VTPPISAYHEMNRDNFEPNIDSVGTPPKRLRAEWRMYPYTTACSRAQRLRPHTRPRNGPVGQDPRQGARVAVSLHIDDGDRFSAPATGCGRRLGV
jgi:hypothetical protein